MSQLAQHPAYTQVADLLDSVGQRYRVFRILQGLILFLALLAASTIGAAVLASVAGPGFWARVIGVLYLAANLAGLGWWVARPVLLRPGLLQIARLIEGRIGGIHNGLTNMVLLAKADDLQKNRWMGEIFNEVAGNVSQQPVHDALKYKELLRPALRSWGLALPLIIAGLLVPARVSQGLSQMVAPSEFVPVVGQVKILEVLPGDTTIIRGRSLDISVTASGPGASAGAGDLAAAVFFEGEPQGYPMAAVGAAGEESARRFTFVREHVDEPIRYRVEVGGTQSQWYKVNAIKQVSLGAVTLAADPPAYTKQQMQRMTLSAEDLLKQPITVIQGSKLQATFDIDVGVSAGMLQVGDGSPVPATASAGGKRFAGEMVLKEGTTLSLLLTDGGGQIIARIPEQPVNIHVTPDSAPAIEMKWPAQDMAVAPARELRIEANLKDDYGITSARLLYSTNPDEPLVAVGETKFADRPTVSSFTGAIRLTPEQAVHGKSVYVQIEATDNRDLTAIAPELGMQTTQTRKYEIRFRDPQQIARDLAEKNDKLRQRLEEMLKQQQGLQEKTLGLKTANRVPMPAGLRQVELGQDDLRTLMTSTAQTFQFDGEARVIQKTLQTLAGGAAREAVEFARAAGAEQDSKQQARIIEDLGARQRRVIQILESMLAMLRVSPEMAAQPTQRRAGDLENPRQELEKLKEALGQFMKEEKRILEQTTTLAKKPVDTFDDKDKKLLEDLKLSQEKLDAFMQDKVHDFSNVAEQDMANASLLKELLEIYTEVTMAKNALNDKATEIAVAAEQNGLELAKETSSNLEKWLMDKPDRQKWTQEDQLTRTEAPMMELPTELEDMVGELMEQQEDLFDEMEDANANWHDSLDKGAGWDAADGPIDNMSAKGVTGNQLPNNNEMGGRAGEGRSGKSQGEMVEETATGKGGRNTPTRLDPTAFQQGQIKDTSTDPVGGATGGGKLSGQGGAGLEGPVGPKAQQEMKRLAQKQAEIRNSAERINLQYKLGKYDNFKLLESIAIMRRVESDLNANRYQMSLRRKDIVLDALDNSRTLLGGQISVQHDTTPAANRKLQLDISDAMKGTFPPAWEGALKEYYKKLGQE